METTADDVSVVGSVAAEATFNQPQNHILSGAPIAHIPTLNTMTITGGVPVMGGVPVASMVPAASVAVATNMAAPIRPTATATAVPAVGMPQVAAACMPTVMAMPAVSALPTAATMPVTSPARITAVNSMTALGAVTAAATGLPIGTALPSSAGSVAGVKPTGSTSLTTLPSQATAIGALRQKVMPTSDKVLDKQRLEELVKEIDPLEQLDEDVEEMLLQIADDFIDTVVGASCQLAQHRKSNTVEAKDVQIHLERKWNMWIAGFGSDEVRPYKKATTTEAHRQRMALIKKTLKKY